jgi:hypothetical protein
MDAGQWVIIGLCVILGLWFVAGHLSNGRKVRKVSRAAEAALTKYGRVSGIRRLGNSGAQFIVERAEIPFRQIEMVFLLEGRENPLLWFFERIRGRRDELVLRANLRTAPAQEISLAESQDREFKARILGEHEKPYEWIAAPTGLEMARRGAKDAAMVERLKRFLEDSGLAVRRLSIQSKEPHLTVRVRLFTDGILSIEVLLEAIRNVVQRSTPG